MIELTPNVHLLPLMPFYGINTYLIEGVLIDAGTRFHAPYLIHLVRRQRIVAHALTHAHPDHQGASHALCAARHVPLWCSTEDAPAIEQGRIAALLPPSTINRALVTLFAGSPHPVTRHLREGDRIGSFEVIHTPGHTPGHVSLWRERDRSLILGDLLANCHPITQRPGLREPNPRFTLDRTLNQQSARRVAALRPRLIGFGHGPPLRDPDQFRAFIDSLPQ